MNPLIQDLENRLRTALHGTTLSLAHDILAEVDLNPLPSWVLPGGGIKIVDAEIIQRSEDGLNLSGHADFPTKGRVSLTFEINAIGGVLQADLEMRLSESQPLSRLFDDVGFDVPAALKGLLYPESLVALKVDRRSGRLQLYLQMSGSQQIHLGPINLSIVISEAVVDLSPVALESVSGSIRIGSQTLTLTAPAQGEFELHVDAANMTLAGLFAQLGIQLPPLPSLPIISQPMTRLLIESVEGTVCLGGSQRISGIGTLTVSVANYRGQLGAVVALVPMAKLRFSSLHDALAPFDALLDLVSFGDPAFVLSTVTATDYPVVDTAGRWARTAVTTGATFFGKLRLDGFGLEVVSSLLHGVEQLPFALPVTEDLADLRIHSSLDQQLDLLPGVLTIDHFSLTFAPDPLDVSVQGAVHLSLFGERLPELTLGAAVAPGAYRFYLQSATEWEHPLGLPFTIEELGLEIDGPVTAYGLFGKVTLTQTKASLATKFIGNAPTFLAANLEGELSIRVLLKDFVGIDLPIPFEPAIRDGSLYIVVNPLGEMIGTYHYARGIGLSGTISFLSCDATVAATANEHAISGRFAFKEPVRVSTLLELTGFGGTNAPFITIDSGHDPICVASVRVTVLGITQDVHATVGADHISLDVDSSAGPVAVLLKVIVGEGAFTADGHASFGLSGAIGPLSLGQGMPELGTLQLQAQLKTDVVAAADTHGNASVKVSGSFEVGGIHVDVPQITVNVQSLEQLPQAILEYIQHNATELFKALLSTPDAWLKAIGQGIIVGVANVAKVLIQQFQQAPTVVAKALLNTLQMGVNDATKQLQEAGQTIADISKSLADLGQAPNVIRSALELLGAPADEISRALQAAFPGIPHGDIATVPHADLGAVAHADVHGVHTDIGAQHTDTTTGHTDGTTGHTDGTTGHTDEGGGWVPHFDAGGVHTDIGGVHTDVAGVHSDIGTARVDTEVPPHLDTPAKAHIDTPATLHVDVP